jgi:hypothetical protein
MDLLSIAAGFLGGIVGWGVTAFIAEPLKGLLTARSEAAQALTQFEGCDDFDPHCEDQAPPSDAIIADRAQAYARCGAKLTGFDLSHQLLARALRARFIKWDLRRAGTALNLLAQMKPGSRSIDETRQGVFRALRLGRRIGETYRV